MLLHIIARGKIGRSPEAELTDRYLKRIAWPVKVTELPDRGGNLPPPQALNVMLTAHSNGVALVLVTHKERAELYKDQFASKQLLATIEPAQA